MTGFVYTTYARAFPIYITIAPIVLVLFPILPEGFDWKLGGGICRCFIASFLPM